MGMRVGSGGGSAAMAQMQMAQMAQKAAAVPAAAPEPSKVSPVAAALSQQNTPMQSVLSLLRGQGSNVDVLA